MRCDAPPSARLVTGGEISKAAHENGQRLGLVLLMMLLLMLMSLMKMLMLMIMSLRCIKRVAVA